jgi:hypothetical protein
MGAYEGCATSPNHPPVANAGLDQTVQVGDQVTLDGSGSYDVDDDPLSFLWSFISRPAGSMATLDITDPVHPIFTADVAGTYVVQLIVNDGYVNGGPDTVTISGRAVTWASAYNVMFDTQSDLTLLREYRDQFLMKSTKGKLYTNLLYQSSEEALRVLLNHPTLMRQANKLIRANKGAVENVLNGSEGVIRNPDAVMSFLKAYGRKSPPALRLLTKEVIREMRKQQRRGRPFLGFRVE